MKYSKEEFFCKRCGGNHKFETLLEFPLPENISNISSGKVKGSLKLISKYIYFVNQDMYIYGSLSIPIIGFYDTFDLYNWIFVKKEVSKIAFDYYKSNEDVNEIILEGKMVYPIPFYNMVDYHVVKVAIDNSLEMPEVKLAISSSELYADWKKGISMDKLIGFQEILYHL